jgi:lipocalin
MFRSIIFLIFFELFFKLSFSFNLIKPVKDLNLSKYEFRWYQIYGNRFVESFQHFGKCITADYTINSNSTVSILNSEYSLKNELEQIRGYAYYKYDILGKRSSGDLTVHLDGVPYDSPYWVIQLGIEIDSLYDWAIVTDSLGLSLFVLARDVDRFNSEYNNYVLELLDEYGYDYDNIVKVSHLDCKYVLPPFN